MLDSSKKIGFCTNRLLLYRFNSEDLKMQKKKTVRGISAGLNISKEEDEFLKKLSELNNEKKFRRGKMAYVVFQAGLEVIKKQISEELGREAESSYFDKVEVLKNDKQLESLFSMVKLLKEHGLSLEVNPLKESK